MGQHLGLECIYVVNVARILKLGFNRNLKEKKQLCKTETNDSLNAMANKIDLAC